ncbi:glutathione S-transferase family protein [Azospirillum sp. YIM DDC1]|mgnify:CR=1 FL=1|jgi:Glutathione S-transferase|uniref:Glutathione S-transferase family protein n=1 Tax=Azospirillum aestuarii TaxID=2802052 RepID=A0ABS1I496_9PROT|nr:glutathione S-transferase family protein [Azospirillum aestuarii]MBK3773371.1 glutathione S-transferase family protein [Azospirillum brasilense]MBK4721902.1 glutathione S-transferase family protein [Azospirillum aestuarii]TWA85890.1 glutathione S-transferase [Azospirillum brasilense]
MITLYTYPYLYGLADNNPYGLKVVAFLRLCGLSYRQEHIIDVHDAPRGQLPYILDGSTVIGDSDLIIAHLIRQHRLPIDGDLSEAERRIDHMIRRTLDDLYWVMSYSRWSDPRFWPLFRDQLLNTHPDITEALLEAARQYNLKRYHFQGIGRYETGQIYSRGLTDLEVIAGTLADRPFLFGATPHSIDTALMGFLPNIYRYEIDTPLRAFVAAQPNLTDFCRRTAPLVSLAPSA